MTALPIALRTNQSKYSFAGEAQLINAYAEQQGSDAKAPYAVLPCAGLTEFATVTDTPGRGQIELIDLDCVYSAHSTSVYKYTEDGTVTRIGTLPGSDRVQFSRNQANPVQISMSCEAGQFYIESDVVKEVTDTDLPDGVISQDQLGGYTAYLLADRRFFISSINACQTIDGLDYATAEQSADPAKRIKADGDLFIFKTRQTEQWRNTGNADFPFEPIGTPIRRGILGPQAVAAIDNTMMFIGDDGVAYRIAGTGAIQRISTHGVERKFIGDENPDSIAGFSFPYEGHSFVNFTGSDYSRCFDAATQFWHSRHSYQLGYWRARNPVRIWGKTLVQDALSGKIFEIDPESYVEDNQPLIWGMDTPTFHLFPNGGVVDALALDVATGVGLTSGQGSSPKLMLSWSTDGGATFKGNRELSLGTYGNRVRVTTRRLGRFGEKGIIFRIRVSDPVIRSLIAMDISTRPRKM